MTQQAPIITSEQVSTALARVGKKLPKRFTDDYFAELELRGGKGDGEDGDRCSIQERRAWEALQADSDTIPKTDCPVVGSFMISFQDRISDPAVRTRLCLPLLVATIGSKATAAVEERRRWISVDWAIREGAQAWLERAPQLAEYAAALKALPEIRRQADFEKARKICYAARDAGWKLRQTKVEELRDKLVPLVKAELEKRGIGPDSPAVAGAVAGAVAVAGARYSDRWYAIRSAVYEKLRYSEEFLAWREGFLASVGDTRLAVWESGAKCVERMLAATEESL